MDAKTKKAAIIFALMFLTYIAVDAAPPGSAIAEGGNITPLLLSVKSLTQKWQGIPGTIFISTPFAPPNVTAYGGNVTETDINVSAPCANPTITGNILFSNSSSPPIGLTPGNLAQLDAFVGIAPDDASKTFTTTSTFTINGIPINNIPTTYTYVNEAPQKTTFREGYLNDAAGNIVFSVEVYIPTQGYNTSFFRYQALLPVFNKTSTLYYLTSDLNVICPPPPSGGGGGGGATRRCIPKWNCTQWGHCENGIQTRICDCNCGNITGPALKRTCMQEQSPTEITEQEIIQEKHEQTLNITIPKITTYLGEEFETPIRIRNPGQYSIEDLIITIKSSQYYQQLEILHTNPFYPAMFGLTPFEKLTIETTITQTPTPIIVNPEETITTNITPTAPIIKPQTINSFIEARSYDMPIAGTEALIEIEARPFKIFSTKENSRTNLIIAIDNRNQPAKTANVEVDYNEGRTTKFMELYTIDLPANEVAMYGYTYIIPFQYDNIVGRYQNYKSEVR